MLSDPTPKRRWPRSERFILSPRGVDAEAQYRSSIVASRVDGGRAAFDTARALWAAAHGVQPDDGAYLTEVRSGPTTLAELVEALDTSGKSRTDALAALERLFDNGLISTAVHS